MSTSIRKINYPVKISKEEINQLHIRSFPGTIRHIETQDELRKAVPALKRENILGFDTETKPTFRKGVLHVPSLVQLATGRTVYLIRLNLLEQHDELLPILSSPTCLKVGVAVRDDIIGLQKIKPFVASGFVDIATISKELGIETIGLRSLAAIFLKFRISKKAQVSNWARRELSPSQIQYAATDAWVSRKIFLKLRRFNRLAESIQRLSKESLTLEDAEKKSAKQPRKRSRRRNSNQPRKPDAATQEPEKN